MIQHYSLMWLLLCSLPLLCFTIAAAAAAEASSHHSEGNNTSTTKPIIVLVKVGGSSITDKAVKETLNESALEWFAQTIHTALSATSRSTSSSRPNLTFVIVHGAGSFGHHTAKEFGLRGQTQPPPSEILQGKSFNVNDDAGNYGCCHHTRTDATTGQNVDSQQKRLMQGLSQTRLSVQKLNLAVVTSLVNVGLPAVGISPCLAVTGLQAHGGGEYADGCHSSRVLLQHAVWTAVKAGLIPVLHGDACLYGSRGAGILSGDVVMELLGTADWVTTAIFLTDVDGVFTVDPNTDPNNNARLIRTLTVDPVTAAIVTVSVFRDDTEKVVPQENEECDNEERNNYSDIENSSSMRLDITGSTHAHDVTGGLQTKLQAAAAITASGKNVTIVRCASESAELALMGLPQATTSGTIMVPRWRLVPES